MGLSIDAFTAASRPRRMVCAVTRIAQSLAPKDRKVLEDALANEAITHSAIASVLTDNGHRVNGGTVARHRNKGCSCAR